MSLFVNDCGVICPLGDDVASAAAGLAAAERAFTPSDTLVEGRLVQVGAVLSDLPSAPPQAAAWDCRNNRLMLAALLQIAPSVEAAVKRHGSDRVAVVLGTSTSGMAEGEAAVAARLRDGVWPKTFDYRQQEIGNIALFAAAALGLSGPAYAIAAACASSAKVFASARRLIRAGLADAVVVGGADTLCRMTLNGFASLEALSPGMCNPFSRNRDGITIGEGAAAFLISASEGPVELLGIGESSDAHHTTAPDPEGRGAAAAMVQALRQAGLQPEDIGYINLHGTGTPLNDSMEALAVSSIFPTATPVSSTKAMTGHMLGAAGGVEAAFLWMTLAGRSEFLPPHLWDGIADPNMPPLSLVQPGARLRGGRQAMMSNSFGFGGSNASLILGSC